MRKLLCLTLLVSAVAAMAQSGADARSARVGRTAQVTRGLAIATSHCSACHAVTAGGISPDPEAPPWDAVVNKPGLTLATLRTFLRDSHNYPTQMNFEIAPAQIADIAAYMITLKRRNYRPPTQ
jgi:mono/diheme cytochrome c family protein